MANIPLRAYEKMIEELIDQSKLQEAIAHCKHILKTYPKNISTYRILGKAFLEGKSYNETADVFKRVLTVYPDDFISHVGMSLVRENENNLDAAIWHMELAFDSQPSNITIQEELKRLFGRRDGTHPTKIRLTRGALVRMYARGELYQQAIAEINSAVTEDIKRTDLEVFLAKMYYLSGDQKSAIDLCQKLEKEAPYCYEINKILFDTSPNANHADKSNNYAVRLMELDPYEEFINAKFPTLEDIPDDRVLVEELTDFSSISTGKENTWVSSLNNEWDKPSFIPEPVMTAFSDQASSSVEPSANESAASPEKVFGDMNSSSFTDPSEAFTEKNPPSQSQPIKSDDWLSNLSSDSSSIEKPEETSQDQAAPAEVPDWLRSLVPDENTSEQTPVTESSSPFDDLGSEEQPTPDATNKESTFSPFEEQPQVNDISNQNKEEAGLPDWLKNFEGEKSAEPVSQDDLPDWLNSLDARSQIDKSASNPLSIEEPKPETESAISSAFSFDETEISTPQSPLDAISANAFAAEITEENPEKLIEEPEAQSVGESNEIPEWIRNLHGSEEKEQESIPVSEQASEDFTASPVQSQESTEDFSNVESLSPDQAISDKTSDDLLDWLRELKPEDNQSTLPQTDNLQEPKENTGGLSYDFDAELKKLSGIEPEETVDQPRPEPVAAPVEDTDDFLRNLSGIEDIADAVSEPETQLIGSPQQEESELVDIEESETPIDTNSDFSTQETAQVSQSIEPSPIPDSFERQFTPLDSMSPGSLQELMDATKRNPEDYQSWRKLGDAYAEEGKYSDALFAYNKAEQILLKIK